MNDTPGRSKEPSSALSAEPEAIDGVEEPYVSPLIRRLEDRRPSNLSTICESCPASMWFDLVSEIRCYCRIMHTIVWSKQEPNTIEFCDGQFLEEANRVAGPRRKAEAPRETVEIPPELVGGRFLAP